MGIKKTAEGGRRRLWSEAEARAVLKDLSGWDGSLIDFARSKGVTTQRLGYWRKRLTEVSAPAFLPVALPKETPAPRAPIEIVVGGVVVRVPDGADLEQVAGLVQVLARRLGC